MTSLTLSLLLVTTLWIQTDSSTLNWFGFRSSFEEEPVTAAVATLTVTRNGIRGKIYLKVHKRGILERMVTSMCWLRNCDVQLKIHGEITGLNPGHHGMHIHEYGDLSAGCESVGSHYNPGKVDHGAPTASIWYRHIGDLGNIEADHTGTATIDMLVDGVHLMGPFTVLGRALVIHEKRDDFGAGDGPESKVNGNTGQRLACGIIGITKIEA